MKKARKFFLLNSFVLRNAHFGKAAKPKPPKLKLKLTAQYQNTFICNTFQAMFWLTAIQAPPLQSFATGTPKKEGFTVVASRLTGRPTNRPTSRCRGVYYGSNWLVRWPLYQGGGHRPLKNNIAPRSKKFFFHQVPSDGWPPTSLKVWGGGVGVNPKKLLFLCAFSEPL